MGTLYVVGVPAGDPDDLTIRARRVLEAVPRWVAADPAHTWSRLAAWGVYQPAGGIASGQETLAALAAGDAALIVDGTRAGVDDEARRLVAAALERGFPVVPVPGPALPLAALVVSGLPADSFGYAGELPATAEARGKLLQVLAGQRRTLLFVMRGVDRAPAGVELYAALGDRPLVIVSAGTEQDRPWRGRLGALAEETAALPAGDVQVWVVGGATEQPAAWDEGRLAAAIERRAARGEGAKEISQALAQVSGWPRREIYRRAVAASSRRTGTRPNQ